MQFLFSALVTLLSAFLLFQVQPLISKAILPWFGGSPAVWTTAMLFFQLVLLAGYAYAHLLERLSSRAWQLAIHVALLVAAIVTLPINPSDAWKPSGSTSPAWHILLLLGATVGLPYFLLSSTGPLVQAWFTRLFPGRSPYRLYSLSNVGSLAALLTYPVLFEPVFTTIDQGRIWSLAFVVFAFGSAGLAWLASRTEHPTIADRAFTDADQPAEQRGSRATLGIWMLLPALAVVVLLAVTNRLCRDVAVVPFLWIVPLTLYLLSFIITFDHQRWYLRGTMAIGTAFLTLLVCATMSAADIDAWFNNNALPFNPGAYLKNVYFESTLYLAWLFFACMVCHGELYRAKPDARHLTLYYLCISAGGALGGLFVAIVCPLIFSTYWEWEISVLLVYVLSAAVATFVAFNTWSQRSYSVGMSSLLFALGGLLLVTAAVRDSSYDPTAVLQVRNFYGVLTVREYTPKTGPQESGYTLTHGRILHGFQYRKPELRREATTYYGPRSGPGLVFQTLRERQENVRYAIVGLGTGNMAVYSQPGDYLCFYEIDPHVVALQGEYFTYVEDSPADVHIEMGDARIALENQAEQNFDLLLMDAFSGDAVPVHLVTREALQAYSRHMKPDGIIMFHISNRYVDLLPVLRALAIDSKMHLLRFYKSETDGFTDMATDYVGMTYDDDLVERLKGRAVVMDPQEGERILWTDQFSNLIQVLK